jgi:hypothetical protein
MTPLSGQTALVHIQGTLPSILGDAFGLHILAFRDPDNIQLELTAAYS